MKKIIIFTSAVLVILSGIFDTAFLSIAVSSHHLFADQQATMILLCISLTSLAGVSGKKQAAAIPCRKK